MNEAHPEPKVTIITTAYNQADIIENSLRGALAQDYSNLEVILADDASSDHIAEVAAKYQSDLRFRYLRNSTNLGIFANYRNALFHHATGDWLLIVDGDDYLIDPHYIRNAIKQVQHYRAVVLIFAGCRMLGEDGRFRDYVPTRREWQCENGFDYFLRWGVNLGVPHQAALYRRDLALQLDFYRYPIISGDWEGLRRLVLHGNVLMHGRPVVVWYRHSTSNSHKVNVAERVADLQNILQPYVYGISLGLDKSKLDQWKERTLALYAENHLRMCLHAGRLNDARDFLQHIRETEPQAYHACLVKVATNPRLLFFLGLYLLGRKRFVVGASNLWRQLTWRQNSLE
ncbi:MAG: hypothetical protein C4294_19910 [Nitrospiraceae bacterium]